MAIAAFFCLWIEQRLAWLSHVSGVCLLILLAIILSSLGLIPHRHEIYDFFMGPSVPVAIALMVFGLQFKNVLTFSPSLLKIFAVGILASVLGGVAMAVAFSERLGANAPKLAAQLTASYIGGNENAVAIAKILEVPHDFFLAVFAVDQIITSLWMVITLTLAKSTMVENSDPCTLHSESSHSSVSINLVSIFASIALALFSVEISHFLSRWLGLFHPLLYLGGVAFLMSRFSFIQTFVKPAYFLGALIFAPFFFAAGAVSDLHALINVPIEALLMPFFIVGIHGLTIYSIGKALLIPSSEISLASQALVGGAGTAIALAQAKNWKTGISSGLILGLVGYAIANFCGVFVYHLSTFIIHYLRGEG